MYLKPRRRTARRRGFSIRRVFVLIVVPLLIVGLIAVYENRDAIRPIVARVFNDVAQQAADTVATIGAPTPTPTPDPTDNRRLAEAAWSNGQFQEAVRLYASILPALPNDVTAHYYYTLGLIMQGQIDDAVEAAENTVTANPFSSDAWAIRALALNRSGDLRASIVSALRAIELKPDSARARAYLAESYADLGQFTRAQQEIERALEANPESYEAHYVSGLYQWEVNFDFITARNELQDAYDLSNGAAHVGLNLARLILFTPGQSDSETQAALALLQDILDRNPDSAPILYQMGTYSWRTLGDSDAGEAYLRRCVSAVPEDIFCNYELGRALNNLGKTDEARQAFERAIEAGSTNPYHYWWAGTTQLSGLGNCGSALRYFQPGYQILQAELAAGSTTYNSIENLEVLVSDYETAMAPCVGGSFGATPTPDPNATATPEPADA
ncbi:MAG: tetratricopeptide repeat protein [Chloroflexi bacterium]|nr:tetratricopeptide repeat protein [Chloroflexota bacterium]